MITVNYTLEEVADEAYNLFLAGIKELEQQNSVLIYPIVEKERNMKRVMLKGYRNQMSDFLTEQCDYTFKSSFEAKGITNIVEW
jgi:hypothetical protein